MNTTITLVLNIFCFTLLFSITCADYHLSFGEVAEKDNLRRWHHNYFKTWKDLSKTALVVLTFPGFHYDNSDTNKKPRLPRLPRVLTSNYVRFQTHYSCDSPDIEVGAFVNLSPNDSVPVKSGGTLYTANHFHVLQVQFKASVKGSVTGPTQDQKLATSICVVNVKAGQVVRGRVESRFSQECQRSIKSWSNGYSGSFECVNVGDNLCMPLEMMCDGVRDCPNGEDEKNCIWPSLIFILACSPAEICHIVCIFGSFISVIMIVGVDVFICIRRRCINFRVAFSQRNRLVQPALELNETTR